MTTDYELQDEPNEALIAANCIAPQGIAWYLARCHKEIVSLHAALRAEREAREALAARVAKLEKTLQSYNIPVYFLSDETPTAPAPTDEAVETLAEEIRRLDDARAIARHVLAREAKLREELEQRTDLALRYVKRLHDAEAEREALRARLYALEPLVAEIVSERRAHPQDFVRNRAASGSALFRLILHEREYARRAEEQ